jgi:hypothetical protein
MKISVYDYSIPGLTPLIKVVEVLK